MPTAHADAFSENAAAKNGLTIVAAPIKAFLRARRCCYFMTGACFGVSAMVLRACRPCPAFEYYFRLRRLARAHKPRHYRHIEGALSLCQKKASARRLYMPARRKPPLSGRPRLPRGRESRMLDMRRCAAFQRRSYPRACRLARQTPPPARNLWTRMRLAARMPLSHCFAHIAAGAMMV